MHDRFSIRLDASVTPIRFVLESADRKPVCVDEIRVTELGLEEPVWRVVHDDGFASEMVDAGILTEEEAAGAEAPVWVECGGAGERDIRLPGAPVSSFGIGEVPAGMREVGKAEPIRSGRLYEVRVSGSGLATLEFRG